MTGSPTRHPISMFCAVLVAATTVLTALPAPARAHSKSAVWEQRRHIRHRAKSQTGASYRYGGTTPRGFDCSGFSRWVFKKHGAALRHSSLSQFDLGKNSPHRRVWKRGKLKVGDLVFHKTTSARVGHVGIYVGRGKFISSTSSGGVRVRSLWDPYYWGSRWVGATRLNATRA